MGWAKLPQVDEEYRQILTSMSSVSRIFQKPLKFLINIRKIKKNQVSCCSMQEQEDLAFFCAVIQSKTALRILKKHDKVCYRGLVKPGVENRIFGNNNNVDKVIEMQMRLMKSAFALELIAHQINSKEKKDETKLFDQCLLLTGDGPPSLSVTLKDSTVLNVDLTCSVCLETVFDPVSLPCNHIYCYMCACSAASVTTVDGLRAANSNRRCPLCRKESVFESAVRMKELSILLSKKLAEYWEERRRKERKARIQEAKEYWESKQRTFVGLE